MFHQMMGEDANLPADDEENQLVIDVHLAAKEELEGSPKHGGSKSGWQANKNRHRTMSHVLLYNDYFAHNPRKNMVSFRQWFRMKR